MARLPLFCLLPLLAILSSGCVLFKMNDEPLPVESSEPLLKPLEANRSQVGLQVVFVKLPAGDAATEEEVWRLVDEQALPADVRRAATQNGFRAGVLGGRLPSRLEKLIHPDATDPSDPQDQPQFEQGQLPGIDISQEPTITAHQLYLESGESAEVVAGDIRPEISLLYTGGEGSVRGRDFREAQPQFALRSFQQPSGEVELTLLPEIHWGQFKKQYRGGDGMFRVETSRDKQSFDHMVLHCELAPGEFLLIGQDDAKPGSLGHHFFTETSAGRPRRQLLLIRLQEPRHDTRFLPNGE